MEAALADLVTTKLGDEVRSTSQSWCFKINPVICLTLLPSRASTRMLQRDLQIFSVPVPAVPRISHRRVGPFTSDR